MGGVFGIREWQTFDVVNDDVIAASRDSSYEGPISVAARRHFGEGFKAAVNIYKSFDGVYPIENEEPYVLLTLGRGDENWSFMARQVLPDHVKGDGRVELLAWLEMYYMAAVNDYADDYPRPATDLECTIELEMIWSEEEGDLSRPRGHFAELYNSCPGCL